MQRSVEVTRQPGLFDTLGYPESTRQVDRFLATTGLGHSAIARELQPAATESFRLHLGMKDWAARLMKFFGRHPVTVVESAEADIPIALHELHCPRVSGAAASLVVSSSVAESKSCEITIFGIGGGDTFTLKHEASDEFSVEEGCHAFVYYHRGTWDLCEVTDGEGVTHRFPRLRDIAPRVSRLQVQPIVADGCVNPAIEASASPEHLEINLVDAAAVTHKRTLKLLSELKLKGSAKVKLEAFGIETGAEFEAERSFEIELHYTLPGGRRYVTHRPRNTWSLLWGA